MADFFSKTLEELEADDIVGLIDTPEGQQFEIKRALATDKSERDDKWLDPPKPGQGRVGPERYAKGKIFKELVAFANSEGGWLVLGLSETDDQPKRVTELVPLPDCHELAERLTRAARDWIDPPLHSLSCRGIEVGDKKGHGVVVFRVLRSQLAPHGLIRKGQGHEAYRRKQDESLPMSMREIQDMTLAQTHSWERIDHAFQGARTKYQDFVRGTECKRRSTGFQIILVPVQQDLAIDRPYLHETLFAWDANLQGRSTTEVGGLVFETIPYGHTVTSKGITPVLRGAFRSRYSDYGNDLIDGIGTEPNMDWSAIEVSTTGTVNLCTSSTDLELGLNVRWLLGDLANALLIVERVRKLGANPEAEYVLEMDVRCDDHGLDGSLIPVKEEIKFGLLPANERHLHKLGPCPVKLPRYSVTSSSAFPQLLKTVLDDIYNAANQEHVEDFEFLPFF